MGDPLRTCSVNCDHLAGDSQAPSLVQIAVPASPRGASHAGVRGAAAGLPGNGLPWSSSSPVHSWVARDSGHGSLSGRVAPRARVSGHCGEPSPAISQAALPSCEADPAWTRRSHAKAPCSAEPSLTSHGNSREPFHSTRVAPSKRLLGPCLPSACSRYRKEV